MEDFGLIKLKLQTFKGTVHSLFSSFRLSFSANLNSTLTIYFLNSQNLGSQRLPPKLTVPGTKSPQTRTNSNLPPQLSLVTCAALKTPNIIRLHPFLSVESSQYCKIQTAEKPAVFFSLFLFLNISILPFTYYLELYRALMDTLSQGNF